MILEREKLMHLKTQEFFKKIGSLIKNTLIIVETTLPPGTTDNIIYPALLNEAYKRGLKRMRCFYLILTKE